MIQKMNMDKQEESYLVLETTTALTDQGEIPIVPRPRQAEVQFPISKSFPRSQNISSQTSPPAAAGFWD